jgi:hypothetical protein
MVTVRVSRNESKSRDLYDLGDGSINTGDDSGANTGDGGNASDEIILNATNNVATSSDPANHHIQLLPAQPEQEIQRQRQLRQVWYDLVQERWSHLYDSKVAYH